MPTQIEIQKQITQRILDGLKSGTIPWRKPWRPDKNAGAPANVISKRPYSGCNVLLLDMVAMARNYTSRHWGTFEQWKSVGAQVRKRPSDCKPGHWGTQIVFYRQVKKTKVDENGDERIDTFPVLRTYTVFNIDQVDGSAVDQFRASTDTESPLPVDYELAQKAIDATNADIRYGGDKAFYARPIGGEWPNHQGGDFVQVPNRTQFTAPHDFYSTNFHELAHWSEVRLGWKGSYALGELIAEIGACYMCAQLNIPCSDDLSNHTSYLASWLKELENDPKAILKAASQASKATGFVLGFSRNAEAQAEEL